MTEAAGFYGKAPALGDFVLRRMPAAFLPAWDRLLADMVQASRARLGAAWLDAWNEAPVWHFGLGAGVAGAAVWFGVLIPSVDRVGRHFPFSLLAPATPAGAAYAGWSLQAETLALGALEDAFDPDALVRALDAIGTPAPPVEGPLAGLPAGASVWCCRDTPRLPAATMGCAGLPSAAQAARLVAGLQF